MKFYLLYNVVAGFLANILSTSILLATLLFVVTQFLIVQERPCDLKNVGSQQTDKLCNPLCPKNASYQISSCDICTIIRKDYENLKCDHKGKLP